MADVQNSLRFYLTLKLQLKAEFNSERRGIYILNAQDGKLKIIKVYVELIQEFAIYCFYRRYIGETTNLVVLEKKPFFFERKKRAVK